MKNSKYFFVAGAMLLMTACVQDSLPQRAASTPAVFTVIADGTPAPASKAVLGLNDNSKPQTFWEDGDAISVYTSSDGESGSQTSHKFVTSLSANATSATFIQEGEEAFGSGKYLATYPYRSSARGVNFTGANGVYAIAAVDVPQSQTLIAGTFDRTACPALAYADEGTTTLAFKNAAALLKFRVAKDGITEGHIEADAEDMISGRFRATVDVNTLEPTLNTYNQPEYNSIDFSLEDGAALSTGVDYYVAIRPLKLTSDLKIYLNGDLALTIDKNLVPEGFRRNVIYNLGTLTPSTTSKKVLTFDFSGEPLEGWPTSDKWQKGPGEKTCIYPLDGVNYEFILTDCGNATDARVAWVNGTGLIWYSTWRYVGFPAIEGYKLVKVSGTMCLANKDSRKAAIVTAVAEDNTAGTITELHTFVKGGEPMGWTTKETTYTFYLEETAANTVYYMLCTSTSVGVSELTLTYEPV